MAKEPLQAEKFTLGCMELLQAEKFTLGRVELSLRAKYQKLKRGGASDRTMWLHFAEGFQSTCIEGNYEHDWRDIEPIKTANLKPSYELSLFSIEQDIIPLLTNNFN